MATIQTSIKITDGVSPVFDTMNKAIKKVIDSIEQLQTISGNVINTGNLQSAETELAKVSDAYAKIEESINNVNRAQEEFSVRDISSQVAARGTSSPEVGNSQGSMSVFEGMSELGSIISDSGIKEALEQATQMSDVYTNQQNKIKSINGDLKSQEALQKKIYNSAQNSRSEYDSTVSTVAKLSSLDTFKNNDDSIAFNELMTKSFKIGGADNAQAASSMDNTVQAMSSGGVSGSDYASVVGSNPVLEQALSSATNLSSDGLQKMAENGQLTAEVIKNAMFSSSEQINQKFNDMPMTFADLSTKMSNLFTNAMQPVLSVISAIPNFIISNWSFIVPIIMGIVGALVILKGEIILCTISEIAHAFASAGETIAIIALTLAQEGLNAALALCPITWIIGAIIIVIALFYAAVAAVNKFAGTNVSATGLIAGAFMYVLAVIGNVFIGVYNIAAGIVAVIWNLIVTFAEFLANVFSDPIGSVVRLFAGMGDAVLGVIQAICKGIDTITGGKSADTISQWRDGLNGMVTNLAGAAKIKFPKMDEKAIQLNRIDDGAAFKTGYGVGENLENNFDLSKLMGGVNGMNTSGIASGVDKIVTNTGTTADSVSSSDEDLKYLRDIAEKDTVNRFTTSQISLKMTNHNNINSNMDLDSMMTHLENKLNESMAIAAEGG